MCSLFLKYFFKQKKNIFFFIFILILAFLISYSMRIKNNKNKITLILEKEKIIGVLKKDINNIDKNLENNDISEEEKDEYKVLKEKDIKLIENNKNQIYNIKNSNWQKLYETELKRFENKKDRNLTISSNNNVEYNINPITLDITYETLNYLKENNIYSAHPLNLQKTEFEQPRNSKENEILDKYSKKNLIGTSHRLWDFFTNNIVLIYTFMIVVTFGILFSKLEDVQNKTIRFLKASGASKFKIVSSGLFIGGILTILFGLLIPTIFFIIEFLINGMSSFKYPITTYIVKNNYFSLMSFVYKIVPISDVLIKSLILFLLYGIFIFLFTSAISTFVKSSFKTVILSFGLIATLQMFNKCYNPFSYWRVGKIADGSINFLFKTVSYSFDKSYKVLLIAICILIIFLICISLIEDVRRRRYA